MVSRVCSSVWEGFAAVQIAQFLNEKLEHLEEDVGLTGLVLAIDTGQQSTLAGTGQMYEEFRCSSKVIDYTGYGQEPTKFYDKQNYHTAPCRIMQFDETFYKMPYDCHSHKAFCSV